MVSFRRSPIGGDLNCPLHLWFTEKPQRWPNKVKLLRCDRCNARIIDRIATDGPIIDEDDWPQNWTLEFIPQAGVV